MSFGHRLGHRASWSCAMVGILVALLVACWVALPARAAGDDDIPGVPMPASPALGYLASGADIADVYSLPLRQGDRLSLKINCDGNGGLWGEIFAPDAMSVFTTDSVEDCGFCGSSYPQTCTYNAPSAGTYFVAVRATKFASDHDYGNYSLAWTRQSPTITSLATRSKTIRRGKSASVTGTLKLDADATAVVGQSVDLQRSLNGKGGWKKVSRKATDSTGKFSFKVKVKKTAWYRVVSPTTNSLLKSTSVKVKFKAR